MSRNPSSPFGMPSQMGELMGTLLLIVDAWFELAREYAPQKYEPSDRVEVLGHLVRLVARRFHGLRRVPRNDEVRPLLSGNSVGLVIGSAGRVPMGIEKIEQQLIRFGFKIEPVPNTNNRTIRVTCHGLSGAKIIAFPGARSDRVSRQKRRP